MKVCKCKFGLFQALRSHLFACFEREEITGFPEDRKRATYSGTVMRKEYKVMCSCRMPTEPNEEVITCVGPTCQIVVFHKSCVNYEKQTLDQFLCDDCKIVAKFICKSQTVGDVFRAFWSLSCKPFLRS